MCDVLPNLVSSAVNWDTVFWPPTIQCFRVSTKLNCNVGLLRLFPSLTTQTVSASRLKMILRALVRLGTAGMGSMLPAAPSPATMRRRYGA